MSFDFPDGLVGVPADTELTIEFKLGEDVKLDSALLVEE